VSDDGDDAADLLVVVYGIGARAGRLAADVDEVRPLGGQLLGAGDGRGGGEIFPAVAEAVRRDVQHAHQQRPAGGGGKPGFELGCRHVWIIVKPL
jgi:hypothetical protein